MFFFRYDFLLQFFLENFVKKTCLRIIADFSCNMLQKCLLLDVVLWKGDFIARRWGTKDHGRRKGRENEEESGRGMERRRAKRRKKPFGSLSPFCPHSSFSLFLVPLYTLPLFHSPFLPNFPPLFHFVTLLSSASFPFLSRLFVSRLQ